MPSVLIERKKHFRKIHFLPNLSYAIATVAPVSIEIDKNYVTYR